MFHNMNLNKSSTYENISKDMEHNMGKKQNSLPEITDVCTISVKI